MADSPFASDGDAPSLDGFATAIAGAFSKLADFTFLKVSPHNFIVEGIALALAVPFKIAADLVVFIATVMVDLLHETGAETDALANVALAELFGESAPASSFRGGGSASANQQIGASILSELMSSALEGSSGLEASPAPAEQFMGALLGVAVRGWLLEFLTDLIPIEVRPAVFNDLVDNVLRAIGVQRLSRVALQPAIQSAIAAPLQWYVHDKLRPTLLSQGQAVKAYLRGKWSQDQLDQELGKLGFSSDRIEDIINDAELSIGLADVSLLVRNNVWTSDQGIQYLKDRGYSDEIATTILELDKLRQLDALRPRTIAAYEQQFKRGQMSESGFLTALRLLEVDADVANAWLTVLQIEQASGFKVLDLTQLTKALVGNVISLPEWRQGCQALGYNDQDITILELTDQGAQASKEAAAQAKAAKAAQLAADRAAAKQAAALAKQQKAAAAAEAKKAAAAAKITAAQTRQQTLLEKQQLVATQAQQRRDQIAKAAEQKLLTQAQAAEQLAGVTLVEQQAADAVRAQGQVAAATVAGETQLAAADLTAQTAASSAEQAAQAATAQADAQEQALQTRRADRIAKYEDQRAQVQSEIDSGLVTASAGQKKLDTIDTNEKADIRQENLDQLAIARARKSAAKTAAAGATKAATAAARAQLLPTATARKTAVIASTSAALAGVKAKSGSSTAAAKANLAAAQAAALEQSHQQLDALIAQQQQELQAFEGAHGPSAPLQPPA